MSTSKIGLAVKYVNWAVLVLLIAALVAGYWFVWRQLPRYSGLIEAPVQASVSFDTLGVPHIRAATLDDALCAQGYVTAQDRLFQIDILRRLNAG